ncbi:MAG: TetR/AcrR family transcriptional regulator [Rhodocyclaceae bacterium]
MRRAGRPSADAVADLTQQILAAALEEFRHHGYGSSSLDRVARTAHTTRAALYRRFADKRALFEAVLAQQIARLDTRVMTDRPGRSAPLADLRHTIAVYLAFALDPATIDLQRIVIAEASRLADVSGPIEQQWVARLDELVARAQQAGQLKTGPPELWRDVLRRLIVDGPRARALHAADAQGSAKARDEMARMWPVFLGVAGTPEAMAAERPASA